MPVKPTRQPTGEIPVRVIAASSPGSAVDIVVRIIAPKLSERFVALGLAPDGSTPAQFKSSGR